MPATPGIELLSDLVHSLEQCIWIVRHAENNGKAFIHKEGDGEFDYYVRKSVYSDDKLTWTDSKVMVSVEMPTMNVTYNKSHLDRLMKLPPYRDGLEREFCPLIIPMREPGHPDFFPVIFLMINERTGIIEVFEIISPFHDYQDIVVLLPEVIMKHCIRLGWRPAVVKYRSFHLGAIATFLSKHVKAKTIQTFHLSEADNALESLMDSLTKNQ